MRDAVVVNFVVAVGNCAELVLAAVVELFVVVEIVLLGDVFVFLILVGVEVVAVFVVVAAFAVEVVVSVLVVEVAVHIFFQRFYAFESLRPLSSAEPPLWRQNIFLPAIDHVCIFTFHPINPSPYL